MSQRGTKPDCPEGAYTTKKCHFAEESTPISLPDRLMIIKKVPYLAHRGAFTAVVEDGKLLRCEPFFADQEPFPMLNYHS